jgi:hypothetical protein
MAGVTGPAGHSAQGVPTSPPPHVPGGPPGQVSKLRHLKTCPLATRPRGENKVVRHALHTSLDIFCSSFMFFINNILYNLFKDLGSLVQSLVNSAVSASPSGRELKLNNLRCQVIGCFCTFLEQSLQASQNPSLLCESARIAGSMI